MKELCHVSADELSHDSEQMRLSELHEEHQRAAEQVIGNLDDLDTVLDGIEMAEDALKIELLKAIRSRDTNKIGQTVLMIVKAEIVAALGEC